MRNIKGYKQGKFLIFEDKDNGKICKYDLSNGDCFGFSGKKVKDIKTQLQGFAVNDMISTFEDENYRRFLMFVNRRVNTNRNGILVERVRNVGSLLQSVNDYSCYEKFFAMGIREVDKNINVYYEDLNDIPPGILKLCRDYDVELSINVLSAYKKDPNLFISLFTLVKKECVMFDEGKLINLLMDYRFGTNDYRDCFFKLINDYKYKPKSILKYVDNLMRFEGLSNPLFVVKELHDYAKMQSQITNNKFDKYPRYFLTTHRITCRNFDRFKKSFNDKRYNEIIKTHLEYQDDNFYIEYPRSVNEIKEGAVQLQNCLSSYIDDILESKTDVVFLKDKINKNKILVAIEVKNYTVVQARGKYNNLPKGIENTVINKYKEYLRKIKNKSGYCENKPC